MSGRWAVGARRGDSQSMQGCSPGMMVAWQAVENPKLTAGRVEGRGPIAGLCGWSRQG
jgi:hypothetical protein